MPTSLKTNDLQKGLVRLKPLTKIAIDKIEIISLEVYSLKKKRKKKKEKKPLKDMKADRTLDFLKVRFHVSPVKSGGQSRRDFVDRLSGILRGP